MSFIIGPSMSFTMHVGKGIGLDHGDAARLAILFPADQHQLVPRLDTSLFTIRLIKNF